MWKVRTKERARTKAQVSSSQDSVPTVTWMRAPHIGWAVSGTVAARREACQSQDDGIIILSDLPRFLPDPVHIAGTFRVWKNSQVWARSPQRRQEVACALSWSTWSQCPIWFSWNRPGEQWRRMVAQDMWVFSADANVPMSLGTGSESESPWNPFLLRAHLPLFMRWIQINCLT